MTLADSLKEAVQNAINETFVNEVREIVIQEVKRAFYDGLTEKTEESNAAPFTPSEIARIRRFFAMGS